MADIPNSEIGRGDSVRAKVDSLKEFVRLSGLMKKSLAIRATVDAVTLRRALKGLSVSRVSLELIARALGTTLDNLVDRSEFDVTTDSVVIILPGTNGATQEDLLVFRECMENRLGSTTTVLFWDWTEPPPDGGPPYGDRVERALRLILAREPVRERGRTLAKKLSKLAEARSDRHFYLVCCSAGCWPGVPACEQCPDAFFEKVILINSTLDCAFDWSILNRKQRQSSGVYIYACQESAPLASWEANMGGHPVGLSKNAPVQGPLKLLAWKKDYQKLGNNGGEWGAYARRFCQMFLIPIIRPGTDSDPTNWLSRGPTAERLGRSTGNRPPPKDR